MRKLIFIFFIFCFSKSFGQVYQEMPQYGYRANRMAFDSTLQIPSVCGVPTLRSNVLKKAAIAFDSCNNRFYYYNPKTLTWSQITSGTTIDTTSLSNRINSKIDSIKRSSDSVYAYKNGQWVFQFKDSVGSGGSQDLQSVTTQGNSTSNNLIVGDYSVPPYSLDSSMLSPYSLTFGSQSSGIYNSSYGLGNLNWSTPTSVIALSPIYQTGSHNFLLYHSNIGTTIDTLATLQDIRNVSTGIDSLKRSTDSVYAYKNSQWIYQFKDSVGAGQNGRFGNDTATIVMAKVHNDAGVQLTNGKVVYLSTSGSSSDAPSVKLANNKGDSSSANTFGFVSGTIAVNDTGWVILSGKIEKLNTSAFSNGDIIYLDSISGSFTKNKPQAPYHMVYLGVVVKANAGNGAIFVKPQNGYEIEELHDVQINGRQNNQIIVYSDTQKVWKNRSIYSVVDTTNVIATKTNVAAKVASVSGTSPISSSGGTTPTISISQASSSTNGFLSSADYTTFSNNSILAAYQLLGSSYKSTSLGVLNPAMISTGGAISDGSLRVSAIYVPVATTITGVKWFQTIQGNYTADNYNGIGLYTYSGGTLTLVASSTNDGNVWKGATNTWQSKAFSSTYSAAVGVYFIGVLYNSSAETTAPSIGAATTMSNAGVSPQDFTNSAKLSSSLSGQATLPSTQAMSGTTNSNINFGFWLY